MTGEKMTNNSRNNIKQMHEIRKRNGRNEWQQEWETGLWEMEQRVSV